ncbi:permease [candidate division WOR-3 bacterium]|nr:permease [candidate division WOR-3 bacterium]
MKIENKERKMNVRDYIPLGAIIIVAVIMLLIFPDRIDAVTNTSRAYFTEMIMILPAILLIMGLFAIWVSKEIVIKYLGRTSGIKGILLSILLGALPTGPLYVAFPMARALIKKGARISNIIIFLSAWACIKIPQEIMELQFLGVKFMASRLILTIIFVIIMGISIERIIEWSNKGKVNLKNGR